MDGLSLSVGRRFGSGVGGLWREDGMAATVLVGMLVCSSGRGSGFGTVRYAGGAPAVAVSAIWETRSCTVVLASRRFMPIHMEATGVWAWSNISAW